MQLTLIAKIQTNPLNDTVPSTIVSNMRIEKQNINFNAQKLKNFAALIQLAQKHGRYAKLLNLTCVLAVNRYGTRKQSHLRNTSK